MSIWEQNEIENIEKILHEEGFLEAVNAITERNEVVFEKGGLISIISQAEWYVVIGNYERAMDFYEMAYEKRMGLLSYISLLPREYPGIKENERFLALLKKMDLPVD